MRGVRHSILPSQQWLKGSTPILGQARVEVGEGKILSVEEPRAWKAGADGWDPGSRGSGLRSSPTFLRDSSGPVSFLERQPGWALGLPAQTQRPSWGSAPPPRLSPSPGRSGTGPGKVSGHQRLHRVSSSDQPGQTQEGEGGRSVGTSGRHTERHTGAGAGLAQQTPGWQGIWPSSAHPPVGPSGPSVSGKGGHGEGCGTR